MPHVYNFLEIRSSIRSILIFKTLAYANITGLPLPGPNSKVKATSGVKSSNPAPFCQGLAQCDVFRIIPTLCRHRSSTLCGVILHIQFIFFPSKSTWCHQAIILWVPPRSKPIKGRSLLFVKLICCLWPSGNLGKQQQVPGRLG